MSEFEQWYKKDSWMTYQDLKSALSAAFEAGCKSKQAKIDALEGEIIERCAKVAMDMPNQVAQEHHSYRSEDTAKAIAWDIALQIKALKKDTK
jgi:hypothetical protein